MRTAIDLPLFKGRVGVGMGLERLSSDRIPHLSSPLKGRDARNARMAGSMAPPGEDCGL